MYRTHMSDDVNLVRLDAALLDLGRSSEPPGGARGNSTVAHGRGRVEVSTLLVVHALATREDEGECSVGHIAEALHVAHSTASRLVDRAVRAGMVNRDRSSGDPRRAALSLTGAGRRLQDHAVGFRVGRLEAVLADWPATDIVTFTHLLERFTTAAHSPLNKEKS